MTTWTADIPERLDAFLASVSELSRVQAGKLIKAGCVTVNTRITRKPAHRLEHGDRIEADLDGVPISETHIEPVDLRLEVIYEDDDCLVINKTAGISVHPGAGIPKDQPTILSGLAFIFQKKKIPIDAAHMLVHRIDKETTGCLLVAKNPEAHFSMQQQFETRTIQKTYLALVSGIPSPATAIIDAPIGRSALNRTKMSVTAVSKAREAKTTYRTVGISRDKNVALVECDLHTGRTHQLRVHLAAIGHPILGDEAYYSSASQKVTNQLGISRMCLHAWKLRFASSPSKSVSIVAEIPESFSKTLKTLEITL